MLKGFTSFVATRYLKADRYNRFFSWISALTIFGVAISVAAVIVVLSVFEGFQTELRDRFLHANAHILAYRYPGGMSNPSRWAEVVKEDFSQQITGTSPFIHHETMVKHGSIMHSVLVRGIDPKQREKVQKVGKLIQPIEAVNLLQKETDLANLGQSIPQKPSVIVGTGLLKLIDAKIGDQVELIPPAGGEMDLLESFTVVGTYDSGLKHYDNKLIVMSIPAAQKLFKMDGLVTGLEIGLHDPDASPGVADEMNAKYSLSIREWQSFNRPLFETIEKEKFIIFGIILLIMIVAAFNILTTTFVAVTQKQKDISVLKALGANNHQILMIFFKQGLYLGSIGSVVGVFLAYGVSKFLEKVEIVRLPDPYFLARLPIDYNVGVYAGIAVLAVIISMLAGLYPATVAASIPPTEGIAGTGKAA